MDILDSVILGVIEGFTEFLPISSTGHMIVASKFMGVSQSDVTKAYEVIIQFAAILAVVLSYKEKFQLKYLDLWVKVFLAFIPIGAVGFVFSHQIKELFSVNVVAIMFIVGGVIFLMVERLFMPTHEVKVVNVEDVTLKQSLVIGFAQIFALIPGTSRAGSTIIGALLVGLSRKASAEFSFLLAFPVMGAVTMYDILKHYHEFVQIDITNFLVGFVVAFVVAFLTIKLFLRFLDNFTFVGFGVYRILFGILLLVS